MAAAAILLLTALAKLASACGTAQVLRVPDPVFGLAFRKLFLVVGSGELLVALVCLLSRVNQWLKIGLIAWISANFLLYRLGLAWLRWHKPCPCLGNLTDALHIPPHLADLVMRAILGLLLVGSYGLLAMRWLTSLSGAETYKTKRDDSETAA
jgi:hypothetical protein